MKSQVQIEGNMNYLYKATFKLGEACPQIPLDPPGLKLRGNIAEECVIGKIMNAAAI